ASTPAASRRRPAPRAPSARPVLFITAELTSFRRFRCLILISIGGII
ncbi:hypothetical protein HMPREF1549_01869, partial [Actinomyces johnsonii F0510]